MKADEAALLESTAADETASRWLEQRHFGGWSEDDHAAFEMWIAQSLSHEVAYLRVEAAWDRAERLVALHKSAPEAERTRGLSVRTIVSAFVGLAAIVVTIISAWVILSGPKETSYATALGGRQTVRLADGSQIDLNTDTLLRTRIGRHERSVFLEKGEAYFQVRHDAARPFVVVVGERRIVDLGTKFLIHRGGAHLEVAVIEGLVRFERKTGDGRPATLRPGDAAISDAGIISIVRKPAAKLADELSWRVGKLVFDHATLGEAADEINRYNGKKLIVAGADVEKLMIGGTFPVNNVMAVAEAAQDSFGLHVENRGDEVVISR